MYALSLPELLLSAMRPFAWPAGVIASALVLAAGCRDEAEPAARSPGAPEARAAAASPAAAAADAAASEVEPSREPRVLCRSDRDCIIGETCCPSGLTGICAALGAAGECPAPDLTIATPPGSKPSIQSQFFFEGDCSIEKCVSGRGARRLLMFPLNLANAGDGDMLLALRGAPGVRHVACDDSSFLDDFLRYELIDADGVRRAGGVGDINVTCYNDYLSQSTSPFDCQTLGIEAHSYRSFLVGDSCQWVDITTVPPGQYTLRVSVNSNAQLAEADFGNNEIVLPVTVPAPDPLAPCEGEVPEYIGIGEAIECGWSLIPGNVGVPCTPGENIHLACTSCDGAYLPRACPGVAPCSGASSLLSGSMSWFSGSCFGEGGCEALEQCNDFDFNCPASGIYTLLGFPDVPISATEVVPRTAPRSFSCRALPPGVSPGTFPPPQPTDGGVGAPPPFAGGFTPP